MIPRPPRSTSTDTLFPDTTLFRSPWRARAFLARSRERRDVGAGLDAPVGHAARRLSRDRRDRSPHRSEEHTSELQSLMRISYAVSCLKKKNTTPVIYLLCSLIE